MPKISGKPVNQFLRKYKRFGFKKTENLALGSELKLVHQFLIRKLGIEGTESIQAIGEIGMMIAILEKIHTWPANFRWNVPNRDLYPPHEDVQND